MTSTEATSPIPSRRKLRALVITMGGDRQEQIQDMFAAMSDDFEPPAFSPGVPSRELRNRYKFLYHANRAGLLPKAEWDAIRNAHGQPHDDTQPIPQQQSNNFFDCLKDLPIVLEGRRGSQYDLQVHYSVELWRKARGINRGRAVLACTLAHLIAMRRLVVVEEECYFDLILEDNVRCAPRLCAKQIWETLEAKQEWENTTRSSNSNSAENEKCDYLYYGWLGSMTNLKWILQMHAPKRKFDRDNGSSSSTNDNNMPTIFPYPTLEHLEEDLVEWEDENIDVGQAEAKEEANNTNDCDDTPEKYQHKRPGGNPVWGAYAYWISKQGYERLMESLRNDVGAMLWKGKRMRHYLVKPIDKILPRQIMALCGPSTVRLASVPAFFRAPMLSSKIHTQWDPEFCKSTNYQLSACGKVGDIEHRLGWSQLWLSPNEATIVQHFLETGTWHTIAGLREKDGNN